MDIEGISVSFVSSKLGVSEDEISFKKAFTGQAATHAFLKQKIVRLLLIFQITGINWSTYRTVSKLRTRSPTLP